MATYSFRCSKCGALKDLKRPMEQRNDPVTCSYCENQPMERLFSVAGFHYPYGGRKAFHDGPEGTGETARETSKRWVEAARKNGIDAQPAQRWV